MTDLVPDPLWSPGATEIDASRLSAFLDWLSREKDLDFVTYQDLWSWSVDDLTGFWEAISEFFGVRYSAPATSILGDHSMPGAQWFPGAELNYAAQLLAVESARPALISVHESGPPDVWSRDRLRDEVNGLAQHLRARGVRRGDRVVGYLPNVPEAIVAFLATASIGAAWAICGPEFGTPSVIARFTPLEPVALIAGTGYTYAGKHHDRTAAVTELRAALPSVHTTVTLGSGGAIANSIAFADAVATPGTAPMESVPFDHPLWVLFSSGTTGAPKGIVHGHGGIILEHLKFLGLHVDLGPDDTFFWHTSTSWMMWTIVVSGLLTGATCVLYDGSPTHPDQDQLWRIVGEHEITVFGTSAAYLHACVKAGLSPVKDHPLGALRAVQSTGSPLSADAFRWVHQHVGETVPVFSGSGGTDVASGFVGGNPLLPVRVGQIPGPCLGVNVHAWNDAGKPVLGEVGELVVTSPMPSMPLFFWNDPDGSRYRSSYFETFPGVWRHGDWIEFTENGGAIIHGRSDSTLNRMGIRMGTAEIYQAVEAIPEIAEALAIGVDEPDGGYWLPLFVALRPGSELDDELRARIVATIRRDASPRHVPDDVIEVPGIPHTLTGKKLEVPIKRILLGELPKIDRDAVDDAALLDVFVAVQRARQR